MRHHRRLLLWGTMCTIILSWPGILWAHAVAGMRVFPATMGFDDPGVANEAPLLFNHIKANGVDQDVLSFGVAKTLTKRFGVSLATDYQWLNQEGAPQQNGWDNLTVGAQYQLFKNGPHEAIGMLALYDAIADTGSGGVGSDYSTYSPEFAWGKGLGDLPRAMAYLRPLALTGAVADAIASDPDVPNVLHWAFSLQYSIPYLQDFVKYMGIKAPFNNMVPIVEFPMQTCLNDACGNQTTGYINPGVIWVGAYGQVGIEAQIPINRATGRHVGVLAGVDLYWGDLFPRPGRPWF